MAKKKASEEQFVDLGTVDFAGEEYCPIPGEKSALSGLSDRFELEIPKLGVYKLYPDVPDIKFATAESACFDLSAYLVADSVLAHTPINEMVELPLRVAYGDTKKSVVIPPGFRVLIPTGMILDIPSGHHVLVYPRSGTSFKKGLGLFNSVGMIDADYIEPLFIAMVNTSNASVVVSHGDRVAQAQLKESLWHAIVPLDTPPSLKTDRNGGFGSTGT